MFLWEVICTGCERKLHKKKSCSYSVGSRAHRFTAPQRLHTLSILKWFSGDSPHLTNINERADKSSFRQQVKWSCTASHTWAVTTDWIMASLLFSGWMLMSPSEVQSLILSVVSATYITASEQTMGTVLVLHCTLQSAIKMWKGLICIETDRSCRRDTLINSYIIVNAI